MKQDHAKIIQAGMGVGVSNWVLAQAVARCGQIGVVSGTALDTVLVRRLQDGDPGGHMRRAMDKFPDQNFAEGIRAQYFREASSQKSFALLPMLRLGFPLERQKLLVLANFVEVTLAKEGHEGEIGINFLEKIQLPILPSLYGALLAGVDYVLMGAGIPRQIPAVLQKLARHEEVEYRLTVSGSSSDDLYRTGFSPSAMGLLHARDLKRPKFLGIVSSNVLAQTLCKKVSPPVDGFVIEAPSAGGHNSPPRGKMQLNERQEPVYGSKDNVDLNEIAQLGLPFWLAGSMGSRQGLAEAERVGASGIQVGTAFALCDESGLEPELKLRLLESALAERLDVFTDAQASPTGFPFKVARLPGTLADVELYKKRERRCDMGYLRELYKQADGSIGYRCPSEPTDAYVAKGGTLEQTEMRKCLCNGLLADIGLAQTVKGAKELPLVTLGDDLRNIRQFLGPKAVSFSAREVISTLLVDRMN